MLAAVLIVALGIVWARRAAAPSPDKPNNQTVPSTADQAALKAKLGCGRMTADYRMTDPLCSNLPFAAKLAARGITFDNQTKDTGIVTVVVLTQGAQAKPLANAPLTLSVTKQDPACSAPPCGSTTTEFARAKTDADGVVNLPRQQVPFTPPLTSVQVKADGREPGTLSILEGGTPQHIVTIP